MTEIYISPRKIARFLGFVILGFILINLVGIVLRYPVGSDSLFGLGLFNLDVEQAIPTWFSSSGLLICAILLAIIALVKSRLNDSYASYWSVLSFIFVVLSIDEIVGLHERLIEPLRDLFQTSGPLYFAWVIPGTFLALILVIVYFNFLFNLPAKTRWLFILAGGIYLSGTIGMEIVGAPYWEAARGVETLPAAIITTLEESLELTGQVTFMYALLSYISSHLQEIRLAIKDPAAAEK